MSSLLSSPLHPDDTIADFEPDTIMVIVDTSRVERSEPKSPRVINFSPIDDPTLQMLFGGGYPEQRRSTPLAARMLRRLAELDLDRTRSKRADITVMGLPTYSTESSWGLRGRMNCFFRIDRGDTLPQPSMVQLKALASIKGFFEFTARSLIFFPDNRWRIDSRLDIYRKPLDFWGITTTATESNERSHYVRRAVDFHADFAYRFAGQFFVVLPLRVNYTDGRHFRNEAYIMGERRQGFVGGVGAELRFDSRNNAIQASRGFYAAARSMIYPQGVSSWHRTFWTHTAIVNLYTPLWKGATGAFDLYGRLNSTSTPWTMLESVGSDNGRMRGYYFGRYMGHNLVAAQYEIRQHIWYRIGAAAWVGGATIFEPESMHARHLWLPNGGLGLRVAFKYGLSARFDVGFGRRSTGIQFAIGEAF